MEVRVVSAGQPSKSALAVIGGIVLDVLADLDAKRNEQTKDLRKESAA